MRRRRRSPLPPLSQAAARQVWAAAYHGEPWPKGWRVEWAGFMRGAVGLCLYRERRILLSYADARRGHDVLATLVHEFTHVRSPKLRHGAEFSGLVDAACARAGIQSRDADDREHRIAYHRALRGLPTWRTFEPNRARWFGRVAGGLGVLFGWGTR